MTIANDQVADCIAPSTELVRLSVDELIVGRSLEYPLYDDEKLLLLAEGSVITAEIKKVLKERRSQDVYVNESDARRVTLKAVKPAACAKSFVFDVEITRKLDAVIDSGLLSVANKGPSFKEQIPHLGKQAYDAVQQQRLQAENEKNSRALSGMISAALHGRPTQGDDVAGITGTYLREMTEDIDNVLTSAVPTFQDDALASRALECSLLAMAIGIEMGLDADNLKTLGIAALVHDWGMALVPEQIRNPKRPLSPGEKLELQKHPIYSLAMLQTVSSLPPVVSLIAYQVHEAPNGRGYPRGRTGNSIHLLARVLNVADAFLELTNPRPYRGPLMKYAAMELLLRRARDRQADPQVVRSLLLIQSLFPVGSLVSLSNGSVARVLRRNRDNYTCPIVVLLQDHEGRATDADDPASIIDLAETELRVEEALPTPGRDEITANSEML